MDQFQTSGSETLLFIWNQFNTIFSPFIKRVDPTFQNPVKIVEGTNINVCVASKKKNLSYVSKEIRNINRQKTCKFKIVLQLSGCKN